MADFVRPGALRILDISRETFAREVQPTKAVPIEDCVRKFRFDSLVAATEELNSNPSGGASMREAALQTVLDDLEFREFDSQAFAPMDIDYFMSFVRHVPQEYESNHPHLPGSALEWTVEMQPWCTRTIIMFDAFTHLADGAELTFYVDNEPMHTLSEFKYMHSRKFLFVEARKFTCIFRSNYDSLPRWGYRFLCIPTRSR